MPSAAHERHIHRILTELETGRPVTQRGLARELGAALGLTNLLLKRLATKGLIRVSNIRPNRVGYYITPAGIAEKTRMSRAFLENTVRLYTDTRERIRVSLDRLSSEWTDDDRRAAGGQDKRIVFYGAGDVAEIGYVSLQRTDLHLVGVVDDAADGPFFNLPVRPLSDLRLDGLAGQPFGRVVVMSIRKAELIQQSLNEAGFPSTRVFLL